MEIESVYKVIHDISRGFEEHIVNCLADHSAVVVVELQEQMLCGIDGTGRHLSPSYDDPYFNEPGLWYGRAEDYKRWKKTITPPMTSPMLNLPPRPDDIPNLYINGKFHSEITARRQGNELQIDPGAGDGPDIVRKYGDQLLELSDDAVEYFNLEYTWPAIENYFRNKGYL